MPFNRKFADIEAANHRLASALYLKEEENNASEQRDAGDASPRAAGESGGPPAGAAASRCSDARLNSGDPGVKKNSELGRSQTVACSDDSKAAQEQEKEPDGPVELTPTSFQRRPRPAGHPHDGPPEPVRNLPGDSPAAQPDSGVILEEVDADPAVSPGLGLLPPESRDLSIQMFPGVSPCAQGQKNVADTAESQWSEVMDLLGVGSDDGGYAEVEAYLESMCACSGDAGPEVEPAGFGFMDASDGFTETPARTAFEGGRAHGAACEYTRVDGRGRQEPTQNRNDGRFQAGLGAVEQQLPASPSYQSCCMLGNSPNFTPFQGVAQSFTVPLHYGKLRAIPTPPREEDWPFTDILEDRTSLYG